MTATAKFPNRFLNQPQTVREKPWKLQREPCARKPPGDPLTTQALSGMGTRTDIGILGEIRQICRMARLVVPGLPHHITQRGNRRQRTFFTTKMIDDRRGFLDSAIHEEETQALRDYGRSAAGGQVRSLTSGRG
ncbi:MAG TPA: hypothetical protein VMY42_28665, partial [Thermoguttaceae bacterium]|nr:hypothetical protein [Thermoguttaceae bacterium]